MKTILFSLSGSFYVETSLGLGLKLLIKQLPKNRVILLFLKLWGVDQFLNHYIILVLLSTRGDLVEGLADPGYVFAVDPANGDPSHLKHINVILFPKLDHLLRLDVSIGEHSLLLDYVGPVLAGTVLLNLLIEGLSHLHYSLAHCEDILVPLGPHFGVGEDSLDDVRSEPWVVGVELPNSGPEEVVHGLDPGLVHIRDGHAAHPLAVESEVLCEGLDNSHSLMVFGKELDCIGVFVQVPRDEPLVGHIEDIEELLFLGDLEHLLPLLEARVESCGIVPDGMQNDHRVSRKGSQGFQH